MSSEDVKDAWHSEASRASIQIKERKKSSRRIRNDQKWDLLKEKIDRLYMTEDNTLQDTMRIILDQDGFKARYIHCD